MAERLFKDVRVFTKNSKVKIRKVIKIHVSQDTDDYDYVELETDRGELEMFALQRSAHDWARKMADHEPFYARIGFMKVKGKADPVFIVQNLYTQEELDILENRRPYLYFEKSANLPKVGLLYRLAK